jgi:hypothetical protein
VRGQRERSITVFQPLPSVMGYVPFFALWGLMAGAVSALQTPIDREDRFLFRV